MKVLHPESVSFDRHFDLMLKKAKEQRPEDAKEELLRFVDTVFSTAITLGTHLADPEKRGIGIPKNFYLTKLQHDMLSILLKEGVQSYSQLQNSLNAKGHNLISLRSLGGTFAGLARKCENHFIEPLTVYETKGDQTYVSINEEQKQALGKAIDTVAIY